MSKIIPKTLIGIRGNAFWQGWRRKSWGQAFFLVPMEICRVIF